MPWDSLRVFRWLVECEDRCKREKLRNESTPIDELPTSGINCILSYHQLCPHSH
jgi:hypothetical protein